MMQGLAQFIMKSRVSGMLFMLLATLVPLFVWFANAALALWTLRRGPREGLIVGGGALAGYVAFEVLLTGNLLGASLLAVGLWAPVFFAAMVLRRTVSLQQSVNTITLAGVVVLGTTLAAFDATDLAWTAVFGIETGELTGEVQRELARFFAMLPVGLALSVWINSVLGLLLARHWQALLYNPGGFRREFHQFRVGTVMAVVATVVWLVSFVVASPAVSYLSMVLGTGLVLQSLALVHAYSYAKRWGWFVPTLAYILLPLVWPLFIAIGVLDSIMNYRKSLPTSEPSDASRGE